MPLWCAPGSLSNKWTDFFTTYFRKVSKLQDSDTDTCNYSATYHLGSNAVEMRVRFQSDEINITPDLAASMLPEILR